VRGVEENATLKKHRGSSRKNWAGLRGPCKNCLILLKKAEERGRGETRREGGGGETLRGRRLQVEGVNTVVGEGEVGESLKGKKKNTKERKVSCPDE